jgi:hypothetical protein
VLIFAFIYVGAVLLAVVVAIVCNFIPRSRLWSEYIFAPAMGTFLGLLFAHLIAILILWAAASLSRPIHLYPAGTVFGPLGPSGTDWPNICISTFGVLGGAAAGITLLGKSKRKKRLAP